MKNRSSYEGERSERLFAELCNSHFLEPFVFHSPKFLAPTESEAGDVVLWIRRQVVVFEVIARSVTDDYGSKSFVKRIGEKRKQLARDYQIFHDPQLRIEMQNETGTIIEFNKTDLDEIGFSGVILVDYDGALEPMHFESFRRTLDLPFPVAIMRSSAVRELLLEVDTVLDLVYYLADRAEFIRKAFHIHPQYFLRLDESVERELIAFYKLHENRFVADEWQPYPAEAFSSLYRRAMNRRITSRYAENKASFIIDELIELLEEVGSTDDSTLLHYWELASTTRRQRAGWLSEKILDAIDRMFSGGPQRYFAFHNQVTGCWLLFVFQCGGDSIEFRAEVERLTRLKLLLEVSERNFLYSVFGYGFRTSEANSASIVDEIVLRIADADHLDSVTDEDLKEAKQLFGHLQWRRIFEFPPD